MKHYQRRTSVNRITHLVVAAILLSHIPIEHRFVLACFVFLAAIMSLQGYFQQPLAKSKPQRVREIQIQHLKLLKLIDSTSLGLSSRKKLLPPIDSLHCVQLDPAVSVAWDEFQIDQFEQQCQWERNVRSDFIYGASPRKDTFKYHNQYATIAASVTKIVRSPEADRKANRSQKITSLIATRLHSPSRTLSDNEQEPLSTIQETPESTEWFQLPGKKKVLEIRKSSRNQGSDISRSSALSPSPDNLPTTPPTQILSAATPVIYEYVSPQNNGAAANQRLEDAWSTSRFTTPENSGRKFNWSSHNPSALVGEPYEISISSENYKTTLAHAQATSEPIREDLATQLDMPLVQITPPPVPLPLPPPKRISTGQEMEMRREKQARYVSIRMFDMYYRQNGMGPGIEDDDY